MRAIAEASGVNVALVSHYFGSKEALFRQVQLLPETVKETLRAALHGVDNDTGMATDTTKGAGATPDNDLGNAVITVGTNEPGKDTAPHFLNAGTGERLTRAYLGIWEDESTRPQIMAIVRSALTSGHGMKTLRHFTSAALFDDERDLDPGQSLALSLALGNLLGVAVMRHITQIPGVHELPFDDLVARVSPAVQLELERNPDLA